MTMLLNLDVQAHEPSPSFGSLCKHLPSLFAQGSLNIQWFLISFGFPCPKAFLRLSVIFCFHVFTRSSSFSLFNQSHASCLCQWHHNLLLSLFNSVLHVTLHHLPSTLAAQRQQKCHLFCMRYGGGRSARTSTTRGPNFFWGGGALVLSMPPYQPRRSLSGGAPVLSGEALSPPYPLYTLPMLFIGERCSGKILHICLNTCWQWICSLCVTPHFTLYRFPGCIIVI